MAEAGLIRQSKGLRRLGRYGLSRKAREKSFILCRTMILLLLMSV